MTNLEIEKDKEYLLSLYSTKGDIKLSLSCTLYDPVILAKVGMKHKSLESQKVLSMRCEDSYSLNFD